MINHIFLLLSSLVDISIQLYQCQSNCITGNGKQCQSTVKIGDQTESLIEPGVQFNVFKHDTGDLLYKVTFNFLSNSVKEKRFKAFFKAIPTNAVVVIVVHKRCKADIGNWFNLLLNDSELVRHQQGGIAPTEPDLLVTCQRQCKPGVVQMTRLPFYRYGNEAFGGVIQEKFRLMLGKISISKVDCYYHI